MALTPGALQAIAESLDSKLKVEREHTSRMIDEKLADALAPIKSDVAKIDKIAPR